MSFAYYFQLAAYIPTLGWNAVEFIIANHLWDFGRYAMGAEFPPAIWRPVLPTFLVLVVERFTDDPILTYRIVVGLSVAAFVAGMFWAGHILGGFLLANVGALLALNSPAIISAGLNQLHAISQIVTIGVLGPTIAISMRCLTGPPPATSGGDRQEATAGILLCAGALWGLAYLARSETIVAAGVFLLACCWKQFAAGRARYAVLPLAAFLFIFVPHTVWVSTSVKSHNLLAGKAIYQFYNSQGWADPRPNPRTDDIEKDGFLYAQELYGTPQENSESVVRAMLRNPTALMARMQKNAQTLYELALKETYLPEYFPFLLILSPLGLLWVLPRHPHFAALLFCIGSSTGVSIFLPLHIDPRYPTIFIPFMAMAILALISCAIEACGQSQRLRNALGVAAVVLLAFTLPEASKAAVATLPAERFSLAPLPAIGKAFVDTVQPNASDRQRIYLIFEPPQHRLRLRPEDRFMLYYFTRTAFPMGGIDNDYPRSRIFSFLECPHTHSISFADDMDEPGPVEVDARGIRVRQVLVASVGVLKVEEVLRGKEGSRGTCRLF